MPPLITIFITMKKTAGCCFHCSCKSDIQANLATNNPFFIQQAHTITSTRLWGNRGEFGETDLPRHGFNHWMNSSRFELITYKI